jgi:CubicO group peptidase (beta-lactamase class C family)
MRFCLLLLWLGLATAQVARLDPAAIERVALEELRATDTPGAAVAVVGGNRVLFQHGYGVASVETKAPVTPEMLFRLGSTTKMFTAATVVALALDGKIDLNAPVGRYIHDLDPAIARLTANQLLSHTAGLRDEAPMFGSQDEDALGKGIRLWKASFLFTEPGRIYSYSNPGYWLAGLLAESVAGKPYADVVEERVLRPLGMQRSTFRPGVAMTWPFAQGHQAEGGKISIIRPAANNAGAWPSGSLFSSVPELARFVLAFLNGGMIDGKQVLSPALIAALSSPHAKVPGGSATYGYGLEISHRRGLTFFEHGGSRAGYGSHILMSPDQGFGVIVVANRTGSGMPKLVNAISEAFLDMEAPRKEPVELRSIAPADITRYQGTYVNGDQRIQLRGVEGVLVGELAGSPALRFNQAGSDFVKGGPARLSSVAGSDGEIEYVFIGGRAWKRVR